MQERGESFLFIADLHALTETNNARELAECTLRTAALYLACGVDTTKSTLFVQSHVPAHAQLARLLGSIASFGELRRMIQFKEKAVRQGQDATLALLDYPVLMAADILLYEADLVPVGADQGQHLQLTRDLALRFNRQYRADVFRVPQPLILPEAARIMSLSDGRSKMSKSDPNDASRVNLLDDADTIRRKIRKAKTDLQRGLEFDNPQRPEAHNLLTLYQVLSGRNRDDVANECASLGYGEFKDRLVEVIVEVVTPIQSRFRQLMSNRAELLHVLRAGADRARRTADATLGRAEEAAGLLSLR